MNQASGVTRNGGFCWYELNTRDVEAVKAFYGGLFGWTTSPSDWMSYVQVTGVDELAARTTELGGQVHRHVPSCCQGIRKQEFDQFGMAGRRACAPGGVPGPRK